MTLEGAVRELAKKGTLKVHALDFGLFESVTDNLRQHSSSTRS
jgi:hypothetical protein